MIKTKSIAKKFTDYGECIKAIERVILFDEVNEASPFIKDESPVFNSLDDVLDFFYNIADDVLKIFKVQKDEYFTNPAIIERANIGSLEDTILDLWCGLGFWTFKNCIEWVPGWLKPVNKKIVAVDVNKVFLDIAKDIKKIIEKETWLKLDNIEFKQYDILAGQPINDSQNSSLWLGTSLLGDTTYSLLANPPFGRTFKKDVQRIVKNAESGVLVLPVKRLEECLNATCHDMLTYSPIDKTACTLDDDILANPHKKYKSKTYSIRRVDFIGEAFTWQASNDVADMVHFYKEN